ncbi:hypothetical protein C8Q74DRAFT_811096 [Fomes fomentarius]|nr:hypothetical protein C8Q74DRAFT_811096 [Fomes fomentarius]
MPFLIHISIRLEVEGIARPEDARWLVDLGYGEIFSGSRGSRSLGNPGPARLNIQKRYILYRCLRVLHHPTSPAQPHDMKIVTKEEQDAQQRATVIGGIKGLVGGLGFALPASYVLHRRWPYYRTLQPSLKAFGVILVAVPAFVISAERAGFKYEREQWCVSLTRESLRSNACRPTIRHDQGKVELDAAQARQEAEWEGLSLGDKASDFVRRHQYGVIVGSWAAAITGAFGYIMRDPYQSMPQKVVQARVWAQGLTIGIIIAAGIMTHKRRSQDEDERRVRHLPVDHSWRDILEQERQEQARIDASLARSRSTQSSSS